MEKINYFNQPNCYKMSNGEAEVIVTTDIGPRVIRYAFPGGENILAELHEGGDTTEFGVWRPYGGHRLWHAPEMKPRTYVPDNTPVPFEILGENSIHLSPETETQTGIKKDMTITLDESGTGVTIHMKLTNNGIWGVRLAVWGLTIMNGGGTAIFPQEPFKAHSDYLLPARSFVLWHYTDLSDSRWRLGKKYILLSTDDTKQTPQKAGFMNKQGWAGYARKGDLFIKQFAYVEGAEYADYGCNNETFTMGSFMEVETLAPMVTLEPGESTEHVEMWHLFSNFNPGNSDEELDKAIAPLIAKLKG
jgi:hypothetical protein